MNPEEVASLGRVVEVSNTMKQLRKAEIVCKIIKIDFSMGSTCACCVVGQNPSQTSAWW